MKNDKKKGAVRVPGMVVAGRQKIDRRTMILMGVGGAMAAYGIVTVGQDLMHVPGGPAGPEVKEFPLGQENAATRMVSYISFTCPHCAAFHSRSWERLESEYIRKGKLRFIQREVVFDRLGFVAALIARAGNGRRYHQISDTLLREQARWNLPADQDAAVQGMAEIAIRAGLTAEEVKAAVGDMLQAQALLDWSEANIRRDKVNATPTLIINGRRYGNILWDELAGAIG